MTKNHKNETNNKQTKTKQQKTNETKTKTFSQFIVDTPFRFSRYGNGVKGENKNYLKFFVKTLYKKKNV
nr:MAG TPA: hypothetical protein [Caudoviricetes sp.]